MPHQSSNDKAGWYAFYDKKSETWKPLFCVSSYAKWTDVKIDNEIGDKFSKLRVIQCEGTTAADIEKAVVEKYANFKETNAKSYS